MAQINPALPGSAAGSTRKIDSRRATTFVRRPDGPGAKVKKMPQALLAGPHRDDIEIGASALATKLVQAGWDVRYLILTSEDDQAVADQRRDEALAAAGCIGLAPEQVTFAGFPDMKMKADNTEYDEIVRICETEDIHPDLLVVNSEAEDHTDHLKTNWLLRSAFKSIPRAEYAVPNHFDASAFQPNFFVELTDELLEKKKEAIHCHRSQLDLGRLQMDKYMTVWEQYGSEARLELAEPFVISNFDEPASISDLLALDDAPFSRLWHELVGQGDVHLVHGSSPRTTGVNPQAKSLHELQSAFERSLDFEVHLASSPQPFSGWPNFFRGRDILLAGGPLGNRASADYFNNFRDVRYRIEYNEPGPDNRRIVDRETGASFAATIANHPDVGHPMVSHDYAILTVMANPFSEEHILVAAMGTRSVGTAVLLDHLIAPTPEILDLCRNYREGGHRVLQAVFEIDPFIYDDDGSPARVVESTVHLIGGVSAGAWSA